MKSHLFLLPLLAMAPVAASAQPKPKAPKISVAPAAKTLLDAATANYAAASGVRFDVSVNENKIVTQSRVSFQKPNLLRIENTSPNNKGRTFTIVSDGQSAYTVRGKTFVQQKIPAEGTQIWQDAINGGTGVLVPAMLAGRSPVVELEASLKEAPFQNPRMTIAAATPTLVEGEMLRGVKINLSFDSTNKRPVTPTEIYLWFGGDNLLRRVQTHDTSGGHNFLSVEKISAQKLNPTFAPGTFKFNATRLKPAAQEKPEQESIYWDPRLKVGTTPFDFTAQSLDGATISSANFKGKVLLLDFWATWCGPCVASLPDLQATYNKYHAQGLEVVGVSLDEDKSALTSFIKTNKMPWPQVFDGKIWESQVANIYGVKAIPFFLIIGKDGKIAAVNPRDDLEGAVKRALTAK